MTCDRYWREGIVLFERGQDDPHLEGCADCRRAHASRQEVIDALPMVGGGYTGDPHWQAHVWRRIAAERARPRRWLWPMLGAVATACVLVLWIGVRRVAPVMGHPQLEILHGAVAKRSLKASAGDRLRVVLGETAELWLYRGDRFVLRCGIADRIADAAPGCTVDHRRMSVETVLDLLGTYHVVIVDRRAVVPGRGWDADRAALELARVPYHEDLLSVH